MKTGVVVAIVLVVLLVAIGGYFFLNSSNSSSRGIVCTQDAKQCPDGSYVSRVAPNCEFANCPEIQRNGTNNRSKITQQNQTQPPTTQTYNIEISGFVFKQSQLTINAGDTVTWTNKDSTSHTVTSDSGTELNSDYLSKNQVYSHTFNQMGTFDYHCGLHSNMKGKIIVQ